MKRLTIYLTAAVAALYLGSTALAQHGSHAGGVSSHADPGSRGSMKREAADPIHASGKSINTHLMRNPKLASKLEKLLGITGNVTTADGKTLTPMQQLQSDASGFRNLGQFMAAAHVSKDLGINFNTLKTDLQANGWNLGKAIQAADPQANAKAEVKKAYQEARNDIKRSNSESSES